ncbi:glycosyltransferase family 4 protein [Rhizobium sp. L43]|uniref:glycosyltransferase family 4 protein n=1 Tax=Rhizobium sp. L43 TaxID=2035452 RepID=UPI000BEA30E3|nr:glycosyltransferase family 4 protein [Rhizobium sp. L43]PDS76362.1 hypothetical protein CO667_22430 [Rhizobium sp. L43]
MKVLHFAQSAAGGISSYFDEIAAYQIQQYGSDNVVFLVPKIDIGNFSNVPTENIRSFDFSSRKALHLLKLAFHVRKIVREERPDIVHLHSTFAGFLYRVGQAFSPLPSRIVYCAHGWSFSREGWFKNKVFSAVERWLSRYSDIIINISKHELKVASAAKIEARKQILVVNGVSDTFDGEHDGSRTDDGALSPPDSEIKLLFVGRHDPQKGLDILLDAMMLLPRDGFRLFVAGAPVISKSRHDHVEALSNVVFLGAIDRRDVPDLMRKCDCVVMPSRWEGFGLVAIEAMRERRALIVSDRGALPTLVETGLTGFVLEDLTAQCLAKTISSLRKDDLMKMGAAGRDKYLAHFTAERLNSELDEVYNSVVTQIGSDAILFSNPSFREISSPMLES